MDVVKICEVVDGCEDCPKYGDDCDGRGDAEMLNEDFRPKYMQQSRHDDGKDLISRADAIDACCRGWNNTAEDCIRNIKALPSAELSKGELVSKADAIEAVAKLCVDGYKAKVDGYFIPLTDALINTLSALPSAYAVQGEWIWRTDIPIGGGRTSAGYICSNCGEDYWHGNVFKYCPSCGARMKGGAE